MSSRFAGLLLASAAIAAMAVPSPALAQEAPPPPGEAINGTEPATQPLYGDINPFYGDINPFYGDINPFYGDINPFWGDINPFYGDINPFYGDINPFWGDISAFWGDINPFYGDINPFYGDINPFNENALGLTTIGNYWQGFGNAWRGTDLLWTTPLLGSDLVTKFNQVVADARQTWGASIQAQTGQSFEQAFLNPLLAHYGINPNNASTLQALSSSRRNEFFLAWYDGLMRFSGTDRVDHWMRTVNWTPALTQQQGSGFDSIIGLLDATATGDPDIADNVSWSGGYTSTVNGHGVGVASLMVAAHDRQGVMGIAPHATVIAYNPFDSTGTASWTAIRSGVLSLAARNAHVINMSLGVSGYTLHADWRKIFGDYEVWNATRSRIFVLAAGNDGVTQLNNVAWNFSRDPNLIIVGSVRTDGTISSFSNRPGTACLTDTWAGSWIPYCREQLMNRFIVAPGELILLPDGQGGFIRRSGTSFAAPLVAGAIALLHDRWPWLANYPRETVNVILQSAQDLGVPGVDPIYGHGLLDVQASQSPLDYNALQFYEVRNGVMTARAATQLRGSGVQTTWETDGVYFHLYEPLGATFRDFTVPMSSLLGGRVRTQTGALEYFQRFAQRGLTDFINGRSSGFTDTPMVEMPSMAGLRVSMTSRPEAYLTGYNLGITGHTALRVSDTQSGLAFTAGYGNGPLAMNAQPGFALTTDHGRDGGINPLLALASGGAFANVELPVGRNTTLSFGVSQDHQVVPRADYQQAQIERIARMGMEPLDADAMNVRITHRLSPSLTFSAGYARIRESNALLGVQSPERTDFGHGATSETANLAASWNVSDNLTLAASATLGRTRTGLADQGFVTDGNGVMSTAFALSATRRGLLGRDDLLRVSVSQPLHIENGDLAYRSVQVVDRTTGELGIVDQPFEASGDARTIAGELLYATPILRGDGEFSLFGRAEVQAEGQREINQYSIGSRVSFRF